MAKKVKPEAGEKTIIKCTGLLGFGECSSVAAVDVKDGKMLRIRAFPYDWKYKPEEFRPWKVEARGKVFEPPMKSLVIPFALGYKKRIYSPNRILYPLKRVDFDPNGDRHPENRGQSKYVRISWDEALDIIAREIKRVIKKYGPYAILAQIDGHGEEKVVQGPHGCFNRLLTLLGGYTLQIRNPDSWEGWYWGAKHVWGCEPLGTSSPYNCNLVPDISKNTDMVIYQGADPATTPWGFGGGHMASRVCYWLKDLGIRQVYICPDLNYGAAAWADKWIPVLPNTDAALQLAIAYEWITKGTYDKDYIATHAIGFDKFEAYVLGKEDGVAKTPTWAAEKCGVPSRLIKALAREWASRRTTVAHCFGGPYIRGAYSHEPARLEVCLLAMQGLGKPGVHQWHINESGTTITNAYRFINHVPGGEVYPALPGGMVRPAGAAKVAYRGFHPFVPVTKQLIPKTMIHDAILKGKFTIHGSGAQFVAVDDQFKKFEYPVKGCSPVHMIWSDSPCLTTCWNDGNNVHKAYRSPQIEFMLVEHPWMENDCIFADVILPVNTKFEEDDMGYDPISYHSILSSSPGNASSLLANRRATTKSPASWPERLGLLEEYTEGKSVDEWIKFAFEESGLEKAGLISWEEFKEKEYYVIPTDPDWEKRPAGMYEFYKDPEKHPLDTPTGKLEFESTNLKKHFPDDKERPPVPHWIEKSEYHDERLSSERAKKYPLLAMSNHGRWRSHANLDDVTWFHEIVTGKVQRT